MNAGLQAHVRTPAVFLDKDGTLIEDVPYNVDVARIRLYPEVPAALAELAARGYRLVIVSNQPGIAHGYFDDDAVEAAGAALMEMLRAQDVAIDAFYYCPHHPQGHWRAKECDCRKPLPGLLRRAADDLHIDLAASWMVGDILNDVEAGKRAGCRAILVDRGNETEWVRGESREPDATVTNLAEAIEHIVTAAPHPLESTA